MKKLLSVFLAASMLLAMGVMLVSCAHKCEFSTDWSSDDASHWHACTGEECTLVADKADHAWDAGVITTKATQDADGVKTFTCSVCAKTKTESVPFTGFTREEWNAAFADALFENFAYSEVATVKGSGVTVDTDATYKFTKETAWVKTVMAGQSNESYAPSKPDADELREQLIDSIKDMTPYEKFAYDAASKTYKATSAIHIEALNTSTSDVALSFDDGKLVKITFTASFTQGDIDFTATETITLSDYGTVVLNP